MPTADHSEHNGVVNETLNSLLRGELAAIDCYRQASDNYGPEPRVADLTRILREHEQAAASLRRHIQHFGGQPDDDAGVWGAFAAAIEGTAHLFGNRAAAKALKEGEEHGVRCYEKALSVRGLPGECMLLISGTLLPQTRSHIELLDRILNGE